MAVGTGSLAFLASGPMGGVAGSSQVGAEPAPLQLALSTPGSTGQGLLTMVVMTLTGTMKSPPTQSAPPQDGSLTDQSSDRIDGQPTENQVTAVGDAKVSMAAGTPRLRANLHGEGTGLIEVADMVVRSETPAQLQDRAVSPGHSSEPAPVTKSRTSPRKLNKRVRRRSSPPPKPSAGEFRLFPATTVEGENDLCVPAKEAMPNPAAP